MPASAMTARVGSVAMPPMAKAQVVAARIGSIAEPPPTATTASNGPSERAKVMACSSETSVGSTWASA